MSQTLIPKIKALNAARSNFFGKRFLGFSSEATRKELKKPTLWSELKRPNAKKPIKKPTLSKEERQFYKPGIPAYSFNDPEEFANRVRLKFKRNRNGNFVTSEFFNRYYEFLGEEHKKLQLFEKLFAENEDVQCRELPTLSVPDFLSHLAIYDGIEKTLQKEQPYLPEEERLSIQRKKFQECWDQMLDTLENDYKILSFFKAGLFWFTNDLRKFDEELDFRVIGRVTLFEHIAREQKYMNHKMITMSEPDYHYFKFLTTGVRWKYLKKLLQAADIELNEVRAILRHPKYHEYMQAVSPAFEEVDGLYQREFPLLPAMNSLFHFLGYVHKVKVPDDYYMSAANLYKMTTLLLGYRQQVAQKLLDLIMEELFLFPRRDWNVYATETFPIQNVLRDPEENYILNFAAHVGMDLNELMQFGFKGQDVFKHLFNDDSKKQWLPLYKILFADTARVRKTFSYPRAQEMYPTMVQ
ncbi:hypothetical protein Cantr_09890 [Candida viswanathii]|uniref:Uncharacterized protein n=1 Tax=Candida viswanathii TaxID=5486 RepID=A0A367YDY3_9ASCO|nr:hypothetical protein Cantr_09890 [Candida viswanathii]